MLTAEVIKDNGAIRITVIRDDGTVVDVIAVDRVVIKGKKQGGEAVKSFLMEIEDEERKVFRSI